MASFKRKGVTVKDGDVVTLVLAKGEHSREVTGKVSSFRDETKTVRWEISTDSWEAYDHWKWPAIGFQVEDVIEIRPA